jgi:YhhN family
MQQHVVRSIAIWRKTMSRHHIARLLLGIAGGLLLLGFYQKQGELPRNRISLPLRMISSCLLLLAALIRANNGNKVANVSAIGMAHGVVGDLMMAKLIPLHEHVLGGMAAFGIGHGWYIAACNQVGRNAKLQDQRIGSLGLFGGWLLALVGWRTLVFNPQHSTVLNTAACGYALLLGSMAGLAGSLAIQDRRCVPLALGGSLFLLSDIILASELFRNTEFPSSGDLIWLTYWAGQALIVDTLGGSLAELGADSRES